MTKPPSIVVWQSALFLWAALFLIVALTVQPAWWVGGLIMILGALLSIPVLRHHVFSPRPDSD